MTTCTGRFLTGVLALSVGLLGCNDVPIDTLQRSFTVKVVQSQTNKTAVKVDFLWVIDNSSSMCQEQTALFQSVGDFMDKIEEYVNIDYRIAVVTTDVKSKDHYGKFRHHRTTLFPFACGEEQVRECLEGEGGDVSCQSTYGRCSDGTLCVIDPATQSGDCANGSVCTPNGPGWICADAPENLDALINCNGSVNATCERECHTAVTIPSELQCVPTDSEEVCDEKKAAVLALQEAQQREDNAECEEEFTLDDPSTQDVNESTEASKLCLDDPDQCKYKCLPIGKNSVCILQPGAKQCQDSDKLKAIMLEDNGTEVPFLLPNNARELFPCIAIVGAEQGHNARNEEAFFATILALDKNGPNAAQAKEFLRDEAYLAIVFLSDEDDGSAATDCKPDNSKDKWTNACITYDEAIKPCKYLKAVSDDKDNKGKLMTVDDAVNAVKALKGDAGRILVASIVGDSVSDDPTQVALEQQLYKDSKCGGDTCPTWAAHMKKSTICTAPGVSAEYGERYIHFTERFGDNGIITNICDDQGIAPALDKIALRIVKVFSKLCLPHPIKDEETLVVRKIGPEGTCSDGNQCTVLSVGACGGNPNDCNPIEYILEKGETGLSYKFIKSADCKDTPDQTAIFFNFDPEQGLEVEVEYIAEPTLNTTP
jgi:hypothetical protein